MGVLNPNSTPYVHPNEPNLLNVHKALVYRDNEPHLRVTLGSDNITVTGDVNLVDNVRVNNSTTNPVPVFLTNTTSTVYQGTSPWVTTITNWPALQYVNGVLYAVQSGTWSVGVTGTVVASNFTSTVNISSMPAVSGTVSISSLPAITGSVTVTNFTSTVNVASLPAITGTVNIGTLPEVEIKNDSGNPIPVNWIYGNGATLIPWQVQVARGLIPEVTGLSISGYNVDVGTSFVPIWHGTNYTYLTTATQLTVWSDSASDTNVSVLISGLNAAYVPITETVVLTNGATGVLTTSSFLRVNNMSLTRVPMNAGVIHVGNNGKSTVLCAIEIGAGRSQQTVYTVPAGYTFYLTQVNYYTNNTGNNTGLFRSWTQSPTGLINVVLTFPFPENYNSTKVVPRSYTEKTDIQWQVANKTGSSAIGGQIEGYLIQNGI